MLKEKLMIAIRSLSFLILITLLMPTNFSCKKRDGWKDKNKDSTSQASASAEAEVGKDMKSSSIELDPLTRDIRASELFRNTFFTLGKDRFTEEDLHKLVYLPTPDLLKIEGKGDDPAKAIQDLSEQYIQIKPSDLFQYGKTQKASDFVLKVPSKVITLLVIPGIFSEFIDTYAFHEVISRESSDLAKRWKIALETPGKDASKMDKTFEFESLKEIDAPISEFVKMGSIDDKNGKALVQVITLKSRSFSAESLGKPEENASTYIRRISKIFDLIGNQESVAIVGYSRGALVALELISQMESRKTELPWADSIKAMVSVGGVLYGASLADAAFDPKDPLNGVLKRIEQLTSELELPDADIKTREKLMMATRNTARWAKAGKDVLAMGLKFELHEGLGLEEMSSGLPQFEANLGFLRMIAFDRFDFSDPSFSNYFLNIQKFKWILAKAIEGIDSLRTATRIEWWKNHTLPTRLHYFAIAGTMGDVSTKEKGVWAETGNRIAYATRAIDYLALRLNYYELFRVSKNQLTDSQVSLDRSRFQPSLTSQLNPNQAAFPSHYLGVLGVDHWGMIFPYATATSGNIYSPFPRDLFAEALAYSISRTLEDFNRSVP